MQGFRGPPGGLGAGAVRANLSISLQPPAPYVNVVGPACASVKSCEIKAAFRARMGRGHVSCSPRFFRAILNDLSIFRAQKTHTDITSYFHETGFDVLPAVSCRRATGYDRFPCGLGRFVRRSGIRGTCFHVPYLYVSFWCRPQDINDKLDFAKATGASMDMVYQDPSGSTRRSCVHMKL